MDDVRLLCARCISGYIEAGYFIKFTKDKTRKSCDICERLACEVIIYKSKNRLVDIKPHKLDAKNILQNKKERNRELNSQERTLKQKPRNLKETKGDFYETRKRS